MNLEGARLKRTRGLVNAASASVAIFALSACSDAAKAPVLATPGVEELRAVWNSLPLERAPISIALSEGAGAVMALAYDDSGVQLFDFDGAPIGAPTDLKLRQLARGQTVFLDNARLVLFPALSQDREVLLLANGEGLISPVALPLPLGEGIMPLGICSAAPAGEPGAVMRLAYWTAAVPESLTTGNVILTEAQELVWKADTSINAGDRVTACSFDARGPVFSAGPLVLRESDLALKPGVLENRMRLNAPVEQLDIIQPEGGDPVALARLTTGQIYSVRGDGIISEIRVRPGISVDVPAQPTTLAAITAPRGGGYPFGVLAISGDVGTDENRITLIDLQELVQPAG